MKANNLSKVVLYVFLFLFIGSFSNLDAAYPKSTPSDLKSAREKIELCKKEMSEGKIDRIEMLYIHVDSEFRVGVEPDNIDRWYDFKIKIDCRKEFERNTKVSSIDKLWKALASLRIEKTEYSSDVRWKCIFYENEKPILTICNDRFDHCVIDNRTYQMTGDFGKWLRSVTDPFDTDGEWTPPSQTPTK